MAILKAAVCGFFGIVILIGLRWLMKQKCPDCGAVLEESFYDPNIDKVVYKCPECGKEWV